MKKIIGLLLATVILTISSDSFAKRDTKPGKDEFVISGGQVIDVIVKLDNTFTKISGSGIGGQVDCFLYGPSKKLVAYDVNPGSNCSLRHTAKESGKFIIKLINYSEDDSDYSIFTN